MILEISKKNMQHLPSSVQIGERRSKVGTEFIYTTCKIRKVQYSGNKSNKSILKYELQDIKLQTKAKNPSRKECFTHLVHLVLMDQQPQRPWYFHLPTLLKTYRDQTPEKKTSHECLGEYISNHFSSRAVD